MLLLRWPLLIVNVEINTPKGIVRMWRNACDGGMCLCECVCLWDGMEMLGLMGFGFLRKTLLSSWPSG